MEILENKNNVFIYKTNNLICFMSYELSICRYNTKTKILILTNNWCYSQTTIKQFKHFLTTYTDIKYENKKQFENEIKTNKNIKLIF